MRYFFGGIFFTKTDRNAYYTHTNTQQTYYLCSTKSLIHVSVAIDERYQRFFFSEWQTLQANRTFFKTTQRHGTMTLWSAVFLKFIIIIIEI